MNTITVEFFVQKVITTVTFLSFLCFSLETDTISSSIILRDSETIVSRRQIFELGFFSPGAAALRYLGVFYSFSPETVVWVANRDNPLNDSYGTATISTDGNFIIMNRRNQTIWSTNASPSSINTTLQILDTGNLVLLDDLTGNTIWESFSNPSDVFLPTMRLSHNIKTGKKLMLSAWDNGSNPQEGSFTLGIEALNIPQILIWKIGRPHWRSGPWNGKMFLGVEGDNPAILNGLTGTDSAGDSYYTVPQRSSFSKLRLNSSGSLVETLWDDQKKSWEVLYTAPKTQCDIYGICGPFGSCSVQDSTICSCLRGFEPVNAEGWYRGNWSSGCRRRSQLRCNDKGDGFLKLRSMKVPDFGEQLSYRNVSECMSTCLGNCSCIAFAHEPNIGCMLWRDTLVDVQKFSDVGVDLYIRLPVTELGSHKGLSDMQKYVIIGVSLGVAGLVASSIIVYYVKRRLGDKDEENIDNVEKVLINHGSLATRRYSYNEIKKITKSFREKLGQGGYGIVYKGNLPDGQFVAVKVLIETSDNAEDFINEVASISRTSHVNIVNLLGFCHERKKRALVYEFMPNKSLDKFIYKRGSDDAGRSLEWKKLYEIAVGIARGLEYLHRGCNTRIVHFDIKPQNILLDEDFCPKISDFGLAKLVKKKQSIVSMLGARGTIGYIAPEVFSRNFGAVSHKSDVYSYGMMLLEMGEARRFAETEATQSSENYFPDKIYEHMLLDSGDVLIEERDEMKRKMLLIGLWCIQTAPSDRPSMTKVIEMLEGSLPSIHVPPKPFLYSPNLSEQQFSSSFSVNVETEHHTQG